MARPMRFDRKELSSMNGLQITNAAIEWGQSLQPGQWTVDDMQEFYDGGVDILEELMERDRSAIPPCAIERVEEDLDFAQQWLEEARRPEWDDEGDDSDASGAGYGEFT